MSSDLDILYRTRPDGKFGLAEIAGTENIDSAEDFLTKDDPMVFNACQTLLMVIGKETKKPDQELKNELPSIPWTLMAHDDRGVNPEVPLEFRAYRCAAKVLKL